jgi:hypothetical protein
MAEPPESVSLFPVNRDERNRAKAHSWGVGLAVFLVFFGVYSFRLGIEPVFMHDDYEYTYPSFSLAERGNLGSPVLGPVFNLPNRTYHFTAFYFFAVHSGLIRIFGDGPQSIPLANTLHFGLLAAAGAFFLVRRAAFVGLSVFLYALVSDERMLVAARHGRPEMTTGCCLMAGVLCLWTWHGEAAHRPAVLFALSGALTAGMLSHTSLLFFAGALLLAFSGSLLRAARWPEIVAGLLPYSAIPLLYAYFVLTDSVANVWGQLSLQRGNVMAGHLVVLLLQGQFGSLASLVADFLHAHAWHPGVWLTVAGCLALPLIAPGRSSSAARYFAGVYCLCLAVHFLFLKHFVLSYRVIYQALLFMAWAFVTEAILAYLAERVRRRTLFTVMRIAGTAVLLCLTLASIGRFRNQLFGRQLPYARLKGALEDSLLEAGARHGDRVFVPTPFAFHLQRDFDVRSYPPNWRYFEGHWSPAFREGARAVWGIAPLPRTGIDDRALCWAMSLAFMRPKWVVSWNGDYGVFQRFRDFLRGFPDLRDTELVEAKRTPLPPPYGGTVRVYRLTLPDAMRALDRSSSATPVPCP